MRVNVYAEETTDRVEIISKEIDGTKFTGLRLYLELPVTVGGQGSHKSDEGPEVHAPTNGEPAQVSGPFIHRPGDDDSAAITFWGKRDLRVVLRKMLTMLDEHYTDKSLTVYSFDDSEYVIASSPEDARAVYAEANGEDAAKSLDEAPGIVWRARLLASQFRLKVDDTGTTESKTCAEWAKLRGRSYLGSSYS
jgi:hypothetical protein